MRISDWSSDVCSSDLLTEQEAARLTRQPASQRPDLATRNAEPAANTAAVAAQAGRTPLLRAGVDSQRSEERRVGKECVRTCRSTCAPVHYKTKNRTSETHDKTKPRHTQTQTQG